VEIKDGKPALKEGSQIKGVSLVYDREDPSLTKGIFNTNQIKLEDGKVLIRIDAGGNVITPGAGVFLGDEAHNLFCSLHCFFGIVRNVKHDEHVSQLVNQKQVFSQLQGIDNDFKFFLTFLDQVTEIPNGITLQDEIQID